MRIPIIIAVLALAACSRAPDAAKTEEAPAATQQATAPAVQQAAIDPQATAALERMSAYLRTLENFQVQADTTTDEVAVDNGQKLQFTGESVYRVRRPNAFFVETRSDRRHRQFYYDGANFTVYSPRMKLYAQAPAPATIAETVALLEDRYDIELPLTDLFYWGTRQADLSNMTAASHVGFARINGADTDQYAFRQGAVDWQIWIERGDRPLPRRLVITSREEDGQPQFSSDLTWTLNPRFNASTFAFSPPAGSHQIQFASNEG